METLHPYQICHGNQPIVTHQYNRLAPEECDRVVEITVLGNGRNQAANLLLGEELGLDGELGVSAVPEVLDVLLRSCCQSPRQLAKLTAHAPAGMLWPVVGSLGRLPQVP